MHHNHLIWLRNTPRENLYSLKHVQRTLIVKTTFLGANYVYTHAFAYNIVIDPMLTSVWQPNVIFNVEAEQLRSEIRIIFNNFKMKSNTCKA